MITTREIVKSLLPVRKICSHKGDLGHILFLAGSRGMTGATLLCSYAALRTGAGLVTVGTPASQQPIIAKRVQPEAMTLSLKETGSGSLSVSCYQEIERYIERRKVGVLAIGPGLSTQPSTKELVKKILKNMNLPLVLDADGINALAGQKTYSLLRNYKSEIVITPHPGEMGRLINLPVSKIQQKRSETAKKFAEENSVVCVLKGHNTVITDGKKVYINPTGNPGMATGGSGDVLTGMLAAFAGQIKGHLLYSAVVAVYLHGLAGDLAEKDKTQISMTAGDIIEKIPEAIKKSSR